MDRYNGQIISKCGECDNFQRPDIDGICINNECSELGRKVNPDTIDDNCPLEKCVVIHPFTHENNFNELVKSLPVNSNDIAKVIIVYKQDKQEG